MAKKKKPSTTKTKMLHGHSSSSPSPSPFLGGLSLRGFFDAVDSGLAFLEREAAEAEAAAALDEARANVALVGDAAAAATMLTTAMTAAGGGEESTSPQPRQQQQQRRRCSRRAPAPGWAWVADHLLTLVQQYSGGLSEPVMRTSLWQAWRQLVRVSLFFFFFGFFAFFSFRLSFFFFFSSPGKKKISTPKKIK